MKHRLKADSIAHLSSRNPDLRLVFWAAFFVIVIPLSSYLAVGRSLSFVKLMPDDLVTVHLVYDLRTLADPSYLIRLFNPILIAAFGPNAGLYYLTSMLLRSAAAASFFLPVKRVTGRRDLAAASCVLYAVGNAGIETSAWAAMNMFVYAGIAFMNVGLYLFFRSRSRSSLRGRFLHLIPAVAFFYLAIFIAPHRLYSLLLFIGLLDLIWFAQKKIGTAELMLREVVTYVPLIYALYRAFLYFGGPYFFGLFAESVSTSHPEPRSSMAWFISYGYLALPFDIVRGLLGGLYDTEGSQAVIPLFLGAAIIVALISVVILASKDRVTAYAIVGWSLAGVFLATSDLTYFSHIDLFAWLLGGIMVTLFVRAFFRWRTREPEIANLMLFSTIWAFGSIVLSWLTLGTRAPHVAFVTDHRYLSAPSAGFVLAFACLLNLSSGRPGHGRKFLVLLAFAALIAINLIADQLYFERVVPNRQLNSWEHVYSGK